MADKPWKRHEREVARYFGVQRGKRGDDFGQNPDCEVVAPIISWEKMSGIPINSKKYKAIVVECKQGYSNRPMVLFGRIHKENPDPEKLITLAIWGDYFISWLIDRNKRRVFDLVWNKFINGRISAKSFLQSFYVAWITGKVPKYVDDFMEQSQNYVPSIAKRLGGAVMPLVALHANGMKGRIIIWKM